MQPHVTDTAVYVSATAVGRANQAPVPVCTRAGVRRVRYPGWLRPRPDASEAAAWAGAHHRSLRFQDMVPCCYMCRSCCLHRTSRMAASSSCVLGYSSHISDGYPELAAPGGAPATLPLLSIALERARQAAWTAQPRSQQVANSGARPALLSTKRSRKHCSCQITHLRSERQE